MFRLSFGKNSAPKATGSYLGWRIMSIVVFGAMVGSFIMSSYFIYQYIYRTLEDANSIVVLNSSLGLDTINKPLFLQAKKYLEFKAVHLTAPAKLRNIFVYVSTTPSHETPPISTTTSSTSTTKPGA